MSRTLQELEAEVLKLPVEARGELAASLLESLEPSDAEIRERFIEEQEGPGVRSGRVRGEPIGQAMARIRAKLA